MRRRKGGPDRQRIPEKLPKGERRPVFDQCRHDCFPLHHCPARQTHRTKARFLQPNPPHQRWGGGPPPKAVVEGSAQRALKPPPVNLQPLPNPPHHLIQKIRRRPHTRRSEEHTSELQSLMRIS